MADSRKRSDRARIAAFLLLAFALLAGTAWFLRRHLEPYDEKVWTGYHGEAQTDDYLAAARLLTRMGRETHAIRGLPLTKTLGAQDALILPNRRLRLTPGQVTALHAWVSAGGLLVAEGTFAESAESSRVSDPLFEAFGARMVWNGLKEPAIKEGESYADFAKRSKAFDQEHAIEEVRLNDAACRVDLGAYHRIEPGSGDGVLSPNGKMLFRRTGEGAVFLFTHLDALSNSEIAREDHADFLAALVSKRPSSAKTWIVYMEEPPSLAAWLRANAWMVLPALGLLILLGLWRGLRRLGPPMPDPPLDRRSLLEHLAAAGRFQWTVRDGEALIAAAQAALKERLWRAHPALAALPPDRQVQALAERAGLPETQVFKAMRYGRHGDTRDFTEAIQTLERLRNLP